MAPLRNALRYWNTLRYLKPTQILGRVKFRLARPRVDARPAPQVRENKGSWIQAARRRKSLDACDTFRFLNESHSLADVGWNGDQVAKLWRYNQHYFEDLHGINAEQRSHWHHTLIARWVRENPAAVGCGWEPYPTSLRMVNWIKWAWQENNLSPEAVQSLAVQARWLTQRLEWHLLGNHLFVNAKALIFAGIFFRGPEAQGWLEQGFHILRTQVPEQILSDGGQFERSAMYHSLALEDMFDIWNAVHATGSALHQTHTDWMRHQRDVIQRMRHWLAAMTHPDGEIALFNDAAFGIAPAPAQLEAYAFRLGFPAISLPQDGVTELQPSGYIRVQQKNMVAILDVGPIGPDYLPGHAHADTLSFELSMYGQRVLVDSGTSVYGVGPERLRQRGTAAHNTMTLSGENSSEVWGGFRVARRATPRDLQVNNHHERIQVTCSHDGFLRLGGGAIHRRTWTFSRHSLEVLDVVTGAGKPAIHWHWAPGLQVSNANFITLSVTPEQQITIDLQSAVWSVEQSTFHPEFGRDEPSCVSVAIPEGCSSIVRFNWS